MLTKNQKVDGFIGFYNLSIWWLNQFSEKERKLIDERFIPLGGYPHCLIKGKLSKGSGRASQLLSGLASWFKSADEFTISRRILEKAIELAENPIDLHFSYQGIVQLFYRQRDSLPEALDKTIYYCQKQIEIATSVATCFKNEFPDSILPAHVGYQQLVIILDKKGDYEKAIQLSLQAMKEGWNGDWEKRISRYEKKLYKYT